MRRHWTGTRIVVVAAVLVLGLVAGAVAFWAGPGTGTAQTRLGDPQTVSLSPGVPTAQLWPGGQGSVEVVATNPNPYTVNVPTLTLDTEYGAGGFDVDPGHPGCGFSSLTFAAQDNDGHGWTVPPRAGGIDGALPIVLASALSMDASAANACQGAVFTVHLVAGA